MVQAIPNNKSNILLPAIMRKVAQLVEHQIYITFSFSDLWQKKFLSKRALVI